jgi:uncharacterized repeat protein (TIGR01451 family)
MSKMPKSPFRFYRNLIITSSLILASYFSLAKAVLADPAPPGTVIDNTATGSFTGETSGTTGTVTSNTVTLTVLEVAGITAVPSGNQEAAIGVTNAGTYQGVAGINTGDVVYFDFAIANVGNDPTQFFIPGTATITGATLEGIQIIAVDPDGAGVAASKTVAVTVPNAGGNTLTLLGATDGYIPVNGTVTVRVAVKVTETIVGNSISVIFGNTPPNDNTAATQNQVYAANGTLDLYTLDLANTTANPYAIATFPTVSQVLEANGVPANGDATNQRQEASARDFVTLVATPIISGYKSVQLTTDVAPLLSITPSDTLTWRVSYANTGTVDVTNFQITDVLPTGVTLSGTLAAANITVNATQATAPAANTSYNGTGNNTLFASAVTLKAGGVITINIPVTVNAGLPNGTVLNNQPTANSNDLPAAGVKTDNIDNTTAGLPTGVTPLTPSIAQTQTAAIDPTRVTTGFSASQTPLVCDGRFYQIRATANNSNLYLINRFNNPYSDVLKSSTVNGTVLNGLAYNPIDNYMYALLRGPDSSSTSGVTATNALYRLDGSTIISLGGITGLPNGFAPTAADFGPDGSYYVTRANGSTELYKINVATRTTTLITMSQNTGNIGDMSYNPIDGQLYGVGGGGNVTLFKINPVSGNVTTTTITGTSTTPEAWGTAFFDPIGTFYAYANGGRFYRINTTTGVATELSTAPTASVSDGASCQFTSEKIDTVKAAGTVTRVNATTFNIPYTIQVRNSAAFNAPNVQITENLNLTFSLGSPTISIQVAPVVTVGALTINPSFNGTTNFNLLSGLNSLAGGASATLTFTVRLVYPNAGAVPSTVLNNQVYASTITSTTAPGTPNPGFTFPSNIPIPPPDLLTADTSTNGNTLPASANGDTPSPTPVTLPSASNPNLLLVKRITAINGVPITGFNNDGVPLSADDNANWPTPATYLQGDVTRNNVKPGDRLEYTIYFLSAGDTDITNVTICDLVPPQTTFVNDAYDVVGAGSGLGIGFANSTTTLPTVPTSYLTNAFDADRGKFYQANTTPPTTCKKPVTNATLTVADNTDGLVVVDVVTTPAILPFATSPGVPINSYGFVRFQVGVK